ncbi:hypothetical protein GCM10010149_47960 [Nonomuraea roseoviolacea subsp. roseoviolacea]|uniref:hypothetical protein n=1 Tax=Nonomuraea roseoviolacea TaxID=103837 RepID=UPI0031D396AD
MRVNTKYHHTDITAVHVEGMGRVLIRPGTLTVIDETTVAFIDEWGDQINVNGDRLIGSECKPLDDANDGESE